MLATMLADPWLEWQHEVVALIRQDFHNVLADVSSEDIDWDAWRSLYDAGCSPREAVDRAFLRVTEE
jgi:hypothetical protein